MFGKKKENNQPENKDNYSQNSAVNSGEDMYTMPEKFHPGMSGGSAKFLVVSLLVVGLLGLSAGIYFLYIWWQDSSADLAIADQTQTQKQSETDINQENEIDNDEAEDLEDMIREAEEERQRDRENSTTTEEELTSQESGDNQSSQNQRLIPPQASSDTDRDGLTDLEEMLFGSSPSRPDTDSDGHTDGHEVFFGYSPTQGNGALLLSSPAIETVETDFVKNNFKVLSMSQWETVSNKSLNQILINTDSGEIIRVSVRENPQGLSATNWYLDSRPDVSLSQLKSFSNQEFSGIYTPDRLKLHMTDNDRTKFYDFEYIMVDSADDFRYPNIFRMIIDSFELMPDREINPEDVSTWNIYRNNVLNFEIKYPQDWIYEEFGNIVSFGTPESKSGGYIWQLALLGESDTMEEDIARIGSQFADRQESREDIVFADGIEGSMITVTTDEYENWVSKNIYFEVDGQIYIIRNGAVENDMFDEFYNSLSF